MQRERLTRLAELMDSIQADADRRKRFDIRHWHKETPCGTSACAIGWAALDPWFQRQGLWVGYGSRTGLCNYSRPVVGAPGNFLDAPLVTVSRFFGIRTLQAEGLFTVDGYRGDDYDPAQHPVTPGEVAAKIRELLASEGVQA